MYSNIYDTLKEGASTEPAKKKPAIQIQEKNYHVVQPFSLYNIEKELVKYNIGEVIKPEDIKKLPQKELQSLLENNKLRASEYETLDEETTTGSIMFKLKECLRIIPTLEKSEEFIKATKGEVLAIYGSSQEASNNTAAIATLTNENDVLKAKVTNLETAKKEAETKEASAKEALKFEKEKTKDLEKQLKELKGGK